jgi:hypothetical protein
MSGSSWNGTRTSGKGCHINTEHRTFAGNHGNDAEVVILKTLWEKVK